MATLQQPIGQRIVITAEQARAFLASPAGARARRWLAAGVIVSAPLLFRMPVLKRHPLFRWLEALGGAALVVKAMEALRDWELEGQQTERIVIDIPPSA
jgi:hypothetical protein